VSRALASIFLAFIHANQGKWIEALQAAEKGFPLIPWLVGTRAGVLKRLGELSRAEELIRELMPGDAYGAPLGLFSYHILCGETDKAADWLERLIEQRHPLVFLFRQSIQKDSRRRALAKLMNLPEDAG
jgi:hypothetical protein